MGVTEGGARKSHSQSIQGTRRVVVVHAYHVYASLKLSTSTSVAGGTLLEAISIQTNHRTHSHRPPAGFWGCHDVTLTRVQVPHTLSVLNTVGWEGSTSHTYYARRLSIQTGLSRAGVTSGDIQGRSLQNDRVLVLEWLPLFQERCWSIWASTLAIAGGDCLRPFSH